MLNLPKSQRFGASPLDLLDGDGVLASADRPSLVERLGAGLFLAFIAAVWSLVVLPASLLLTCRFGLSWLRPSPADRSIG